MSQIPSFKLNNGVAIPAIGLGCFAGRTPEEREASQAWMLSALKSGYRHLDTAVLYGTENIVGNAIRESGIPREDVFVTTKLPSNHHGRVEDSLNESLKRFGFDYVDLYLIHWPQSFAWKGEGVLADGFEVVEHPNINETWAAMEKLLETGKVKAIGVSNFSVKTLTQLFETAKVVPAVNQVEMHPHLSQNDLKAYADSKGILLTAYSPTGYASVREDPTVVAIAQKHRVSSAQISLAWLVSRGIVAVPCSKNAERQVQNITLPVLDEKDIAMLNQLDKNTRLCPYPTVNGKVLGWTYEQLGW